jgi:hypothetical protein
MGDNKKKHSLKVIDIEKLGIKELQCSKRKEYYPLSEFRIHKGYYMSYCKEWEREDNRVRSQARIWKNIEIENGSVLKAKTTRMKDSLLISCKNSDDKLYFDKTVSLPDAIEAFKIYTKISHDIIHELK